MPELTTTPWQAAVDRFASRTPVASRLNSADWAQVPLALREQSLFSAGVEQTRVLDAMRGHLLDGMQQVRTGGILTSKATFVADMRNLLGAAEGDSGSLADITSRRRLELIWDFQAEDAHAHAAHVAGLDPDILDAFPAYRLIRVESRRVPRDWYARWGVAGAATGWFGASRRTLVALKTSPIWAQLSRFGRPWPPFDYNSGKGLDDVDRAETERLGLLAPQGAADRMQSLRDSLAIAQRDWNAGLAASVKNLSTAALDWLRSAFGPKVQVDQGTASWR